MKKDKTNAEREDDHAEGAERAASGSGDRLDRRVDNVAEHALGRLRDVRGMLVDAGQKVPPRIERAIAALEEDA